MRRLWYFLREAYISLWTHRASTVIGIVTTAFTLTSFGTFLLLYKNVHNLIGQVQTNIQIIVYPKESIETQSLQDLKDTLQTEPGIDSVFHITQKDALQDFKKQFPDEAYLLDGLGSSPFPASLVLNLANTVPSTDVISNLVNRLKQNPNVDRVRYNRDWIERLTLVITYMEAGALIVGGVLAFASVTIIANTVQLAFYTRKDEIEIMRLIGGTNLFISIPYFIEGAVIGGLGGGTAVGFLRGGFEFLKQQTHTMSVIGGFSSGFEFFLVPLSLTLIAGGILLGCIGTLISMYGWMRFRL